MQALSLSAAPADRQAFRPSTRVDAGGQNKTRYFDTTESSSTCGIVTRGSGTEEVTVPLACNVRPEFEYVGSARRKFALVLAFVVAGASGIAVFITDSG